MPAGRPRSTVEQLKLTGQYNKQKRYKEYNSGAAYALKEGKNLPIPTDYKQQLTVAAFTEITQTLQNMQVLTAADLPALFMMFDAYEDYQEARKAYKEQSAECDWKDFDKVKNLKQITTIMNGHIDSFNKIACKFGLTPSDRTRLAIKEEKEEPSELELLLMEAKKIGG